MKAKGYNLLRRILAWIMLIFFVLLIVNLFIFRIYLAESVIAYATLIALFFLFKGLDRGGTRYEIEEDGNENLSPGEDSEADSQQGRD